MNREDVNMTADTDVNTVISDDMPIGEVLKKYPQTMRVFLSHGLMCVGCAIARFENVRQGAQAHGIDVDALMKDLNQVVQQADA
jgi:hybrid cluster-associated redox disulfide protein